jgi:hypothetical protein
MRRPVHRTGEQRWRLFATGQRLSGGVRAAVLELIMFRETSVRGVVGLVIVGLFACGGCESGVTPPRPFEAGPEHLIGVWKFESGLSSASVISGMTTSYDVQYVEFQEDGLATLYTKSRFGIIADFPALYVVRDDAVQISSATGAFGSLIFNFRFSDADSMSLIEAADQSSSFNREAVVPSEARSLPLYVLRELTLRDEEPAPATGLAVRAGRLWFRNDRLTPGPQVYSVDPNAGTTEEGEAPPLPYTVVQTNQDDDLWCTCNCGGYSTLRRIDPNNVDVDGFSFESDLNQPTEISSVAYDAAANLLWVSSLNRTAPSALIAVDTAADPVIVASFPSQTFEGLASDGTWLWGLDQFANVVVQIDPATGLPVQSFRIDSPEVEWYDLAFLGDRMFLIGENTKGDYGVLSEVSVQRPLLGGPGGVGGIGGINE